MRTFHNAQQTAGTAGGCSPCHAVPRDAGIAGRFAKPTPEGWVGRHRRNTVHALYQPTKGGAAGAGKIIETDYSLAGPGRATRKTVGRGAPRTPSARRAIA